MSIPTVAELLRRPAHSVKPTPAEIFAPHLLPGEELLWAAHPNAEAHWVHHRRGINLTFGSVYAMELTLLFVICWTNGLNGWRIALLGSLLSIFALHWFVLAQKQPELNQCFGVTSLRAVRYNSHNDGPEFQAMSLSSIRTLSVETHKGNCGTICFNQAVLLFKSETCFLTIDNAETVAALILDAKRKAPPNPVGL